MLDDLELKRRRRPPPEPPLARECDRRGAKRGLLGLFVTVAACAVLAMVVLLIDRSDAPRHHAPPQPTAHKSVAPHQ